MFSRKTLFFATALSLLAAGAKADTTSCVSVDCAALGYTQTASQCSGADTILKCPFDLSKVACNTNNLSLNDFILAKVQQYLPTPCGGNSSDYTSAVDISGCVPQGARLCGILSSDAIFSGLNIAILSCMSKGVTVSTVQDLVDLIISVLNTKTSNTCSNVVEVGDYETCTQYCASDSTKCIAKRSMTCDEAIASKGTLLLSTPTDLSVFNGNTTFYLKYNVTISSDIDSIGSSGFYAADNLTPCKNNVTPRPKLKFSGNIKKSTDAYFAVDTTINQLTVKQNTRITTNKVLDIRQVYFISPSYTLNVGGDLSSTINLGLNCFNGAYGNTCKTYINTGGYGSGYTAWCGSATANNVSYNYASSCTDTTKPSSGGCYQKSTTYTDCVPIE